MDPTSVAAPITESQFGYQSNKHLNDWILENELHTAQIYDVYSEIERNQASKQPKVNARKVVLGELWDDFERTMNAQGREIEGEIFNSKGTDTGSWMEDFITNETDPQIKLDKYDELFQRSLDVQTES
jgi:hypothetical protein